MSRILVLSPLTAVCIMLLWQKAIISLGSAIVKYSDSSPLQAALAQPFVLFNVQPYLRVEQTD
jgi:hypothetical protein